MCAMVEEYGRECAAAAEAAGLARGKAEGMAEGKAEGMLRTMWSLVGDGLLDLSVAAGRMGMTVDEFKAAAEALE